MASYLVKRESVCREELELADHRNRVLSAGNLSFLRAKTIERHKRDSTAIFLVHDIEDPGGGRVVVDDDVEEAGGVTVSLG